MTAIVGVSIGNRSEGIGITVLNPDGHVVEAATITATSSDQRALSAAACEAVDFAHAVAGFGPAVWAIEEVNTGGTRTQQKRAASARADVRKAAADKALVHGSALACLSASEPVIRLPAIRVVDASEAPDVLAGSPPAHWRGPRGKRREKQRTAWMAARHVHSLLTPPNGEGYLIALSAVIRACAPATETDLAAAAAVALEVVRKPTDAPNLPVDVLTQWALDESLLAS
jgi:hypothetical protein